MLTSLTIPGFFSRTELDTNWAKLIDVWNHHPELLETWRPVHIMAGKAILEAWTANPPTNCEPQPYFITALKARGKKARRAPAKDAKTAADVGNDAAASARQCDAGAIGDWSEASLLLDSGFSPGVGDFMFWDQFFLNAEMSQGSTQEMGRDNNKIYEQ